MVGKIVVFFGSNNGLLPDRQQANTWTNAELLSTALLERKSSEI